MGSQRRARKSPPLVCKTRSCLLFQLASSPPIPLEPPITFFSLTGRSQKGGGENLHTTQPSPHSKGEKYALRAYTYARRKGRTNSRNPFDLTMAVRGGGGFPQMFSSQSITNSFLYSGEKWRSRFDILPFLPSSPQLMIFSFISREKREKRNA